MFDSSIQGIRTNLERLSQVAVHLQEVETSDLPRDAVEMIRAQRATEASIATLGISCALHTHLIDLLA